MNNELIAEINRGVKQALKEDIGSGDITAQLIPSVATSRATIISREDAVLCGTAWVDEVFRQIDPTISLNWQAGDGDKVRADQLLCELNGSARALLTGERTALNFLQTLSATATLAHRYAEEVADLSVSILDTRKTIPGLRLAQKYAVKCGGCSNHRVGLFDGILIKENHILAAGGIHQAVKQARQLSKLPVEVEVENLDEVRQALAAGADTLLLDNFSVSQLREAVALVDGRADLEASGGVSFEKLRKIAETGVNFISVGGLTKDVRALDLSMRFQPAHGIIRQ